jgi:amphi-Trp domain-containing protein
MPRRSERDIQKAYPRKDFVAKLRRLADAIEAGRPFSIQVAGERLHIPADAIFNIEHEREEGIDELEFQLRWKRESGKGRAGTRGAARGARSP